MPKKDAGPTAEWVWLERSPTGGADGSAYSKLFRNDPLSPARLLVREILQNSWDAAVRRESDEQVSFRFRFRFASYVGVEKKKLLESIDFDGIRRHRDLLDAERDIPDVESVRRMSDPDVPLKVLYLEDYGATGMDGDPETNTEKRLYKALYLIGGTGDPIPGRTRGGSFGFGKSAFISASRIRTAVVHTRFAPSEDDRATQRLVGFTWWGAHSGEGRRFEGRAMLGLRSNTPPSRAVPLDDDAASKLAARLGMPSRDGTVQQRGSTIMLLDPIVAVQDVVTAVEDYWWPALEEDYFDVTIVTEDGEELSPRPRLRKDLQPFLKAYGIATRLAEPNQAKGERRPSDKWRAARNTGGIRLGELALVLDRVSVLAPVENGARDTEDGGDVLQTALFDPSQAVVALMRGPRMVIEYRPYSTRLPVRGVYVASDEIDSDLRSVEPPTHNTWATAASADADPLSRSIAEALLQRIRGAVRDLAKEHAPPPENGPVFLDRLARLLGPLFRSAGVPGVPPKPHGPLGPRTRITVAAPDQRIKAGAGLMKLIRTMVLDVPEIPGWSEARVELKFEALIAEDVDSHASLDPISFTVDPPEECEPIEGGTGFVGTIRPGSSMRFTLETSPYLEDRSILVRHQTLIERLGFETEVPS
jgi:hypothetical protein